MSILLYWLADSYNVCIHYPSAGEKEASIRDWAMRLSQDEGWSEEAAYVAAEESWIALDTLDCMFSSTSLKGLVRLSLHSVQSGATFHLDTPTILVIRFAPRSRSHSVGWQDTIDSISSMAMVCARARSGSVTFHNIEHLAVSRPFGPIITPEQKKSRYELMGRLHQTLIKDCGRAQSVLDQARKRLRDGDTLRISVDCRICGKDCEESDCQEKSELMTPPEMLVLTGLIVDDDDYSST
jgi:RNase P subunit RPR2